MRLRSGGGGGVYTRMPKSRLTKWKVYFGDKFDGGQNLMEKEQRNVIRDVSAQLYEHPPV